MTKIIYKLSTLAGTDVQQNCCVSDYYRMPDTQNELLS